MAAVRGPPFNYSRVCVLGVGWLKFINSTNYLFHFLSAKLLQVFFILCLKQNIYFTFLASFFCQQTWHSIDLDVNQVNRKTFV